MSRESRIYEALFVGQLLGSVIVVVGLFLRDGFGPLTVVGGLLILFSVAGLAYMATVPDEQVGRAPRSDAATEVPAPSQRSNR